MRIAVVSQDNSWSQKLFDLLKKDSSHHFFFLHSCTQDLLNNINPDWVFFFHWGKIVGREIYENYKCCVVHTGNLPQGRGGSPIQNQILDGLTHTNVNIIEMTAALDAGAVYCSQGISLQGSITDIWHSIACTACELINFCIQNKPNPQAQKGETAIYKRIKDNHIIFDLDKPIDFLYDQIRMVDNDYYPRCHLNINGYKIEFSRATLTEGEIIADVRITKQ